MWNNRNNGINTKYGRNVDGTGSEKQVDFDELKIKFLISAVVTDSNEEKIEVDWSEKENILTSINGKFARRDLILSVKMN